MLFIPLCPPDDPPLLILNVPISKSTSSYIINKSFTNPNFSPVFDPSGCQYSDEQLDCFWSSNSSDWVNFANARRNSSFEQLYTRDKTSKTWDSLISHYSQLYDVIPIQMIRYEMPDGDKQLFGGITL